jgi:hypothetical protein
VTTESEAKFNKAVNVLIGHFFSYESEIHGLTAEQNAEIANAIDVIHDVRDFSTFGHAVFVAMIRSDLARLFARRALFAAQVQSLHKGRSH